MKEDKRMKFEKREITLNECDSIKDMYYTEKILLAQYTEALSKVTRKECKTQLLDAMKKVGEEMLFLKERLSKIQDTVGLK